MARTFRTRPSDLLGVDNDWVAYNVDGAVSLYGNYIENKLSETTKEGKPKHKIETLLAKPGKDSAKEFVGWMNQFTQGYQRGKKKKTKKKRNK